MLHLHNIYYNIKGEIRFFFIFPPPIFTHVCQRTPLPVYIRAREGKKNFGDGCRHRRLRRVALRLRLCVMRHVARMRVSVSTRRALAFEPWRCVRLCVSSRKCRQTAVSVRFCRSRLRFQSPFPCRPVIAVKHRFDNFHHLRRFSAVCDKNQCRFHACFLIFRCFACRIFMCFEVRFWNRLEAIGFFRTKRQLCVGKNFLIAQARGTPHGRVWN